MKQKIVKKWIWITSLGILVSHQIGCDTRTSATTSAKVSRPLAQIIFSGEPGYDFGSKYTGTTTDLTYTLSFLDGGVVADDLNVTGLSAPFQFKGGSYPGTGGTCARVLDSGSCTIVIQYAPTSTGSFSQTMTLNYFGEGEYKTFTRVHTGGTQAGLTVSNTPLFNFGSVINTTSNDKTFTITYSGTLPATNLTLSGLSSPIDFKGGTWPGTGGTCGTTISSGTCTFVVNYTPTSTGLTTRTLQFDYDDGLSTSSTTLNFRGTSAGPANIIISSSPTYDYGNVARGGTSDHSFVVTNTGGVNATNFAAASLSAPYSYKDGVYPGTGGTCASSVAPGSCFIVVTYGPSSNGTNNTSLDLTYFTGILNSSASRNITGTAVDPAVLSISDGATYSFGTVASGSSNDKTFTLSYASGGVAATSMAGAALTTPYTYKGGTYPGTGGTCSTSLASGTCTIVVNYSPTTNGTDNTTLQLDYNDGATTQAATRAMTATAVAAAVLSISDGATYDYGTVARGSSNDKTFTVSYASGGVAATSMAGAALTAPYTYKGGTYPGTGGTCSTSLSSGTCTIKVNYSPTANGAANDTLTLNYYDGALAQSATRAITGTAVDPAMLTISDGATYDYGTVARGSSNDHTFTVTFSGGVAATSMAGASLSAPYTYKGGTYPGTGGTCSTSLASGTCTVIVTYAPTSNGTANQTLTLNYNDGATSQSATRAITGTAADPASLSISNGATYSFGTVARGSSNDHSFTVTFSGGVAATSMAGAALTAPFTYKGGTYPGTGGTCSTSISSGTCTIIVNYAPTSNGTSNDTLTLSYNDGVTSQSATRAMTGTAADPSVLTISNGATYDYGTVARGSSNDHTFTVTYSSGGVAAASMAGAALSAPYTYKGGTYPGTGGTCGTSLSSGTCTIIVNYTPTANGVANQTLQLDYNDGAASQSATRAMTGTAVDPGTLTISNGATYDYATVARGSSNDHTFTVTYGGTIGVTGMSASSLSAPYTYKGGTYPGTGGTCSTSLSSGTCTVIVTYAPTSNGTNNATLQIDYNDGATSQSATRAMTGTGADPASLSISNGATYSFGTVARGSSNDHTFTVTNSGGVSATSISATALSAPYSFKGGTYPGTGGTCSTTLAVTTCTIIVTYAPTSNGTANATLQLSYSDGVNSQTASRNMTGTAANPAVLTISDASTYDFGSVTQGSSADHTFTVTFTGGVAATSMSASGLSAPIDFKGGSYPGTGGTCAASLASGTCTMVVTFAPTSLGAASATLTLSYNDGATSQSATRDITGNGIAPLFLFGTIQSATNNTFESFTFESNYSMDIGDVNQDRVSEVLIGARIDLNNIPFQSRICLVNGKTMKLFYCVSSPQPFDGYGASAVPIQDIDGDDNVDFAVGAPGGVGRVYFYSGRTGALLFYLSGKEFQTHFGLTLQKYRDVNGDGIREILIGDGILTYVVNPRTGEVYNSQ